MNTYGERSRFARAAIDSSRSTDSKILLSILEVFRLPKDGWLWRTRVLRFSSAAQMNVNAFLVIEPSNDHKR